MKLLKKNKIFIKTDTTFEKKKKKNILYFNVKDFILSLSIPVKCIF